MIVLAMVIERIVLRPLVNQDGVVLLMATLGVTYFMDGLGQTLWGSDIYKIDLGINKDPLLLFESTFEGGVLVNRDDIVAAVMATVLVIVLALFFQKTATGRALQAVADDHHTGRAVDPGIPLNRIWVIVWAVAGFTALVAGMVWGSKLGVQFSLAILALKALPVVILGGFTSVARCDRGRADHRPGREALGGVSGSDHRRGHRELVRLRAGPGFPAGASAGFVWRKRSSTASDARRRSFIENDMLYRENGQFKASYRADQQIFPIAQDRVVVLLFMVFAFAGVPLLASEYLFKAILIPFLILALAAIGLNLLVGYCGQISLGSGAFMAVGAYAAYNLTQRIPGLNVVVAFILAGLIAMVVGICSACPACASRGCTWPWPPWRRSSSPTGSSRA